MRLQTLITLILLFSFFINAQEYQKEPEEKEKFRRAEFKRAMKKFDVSSNQVTKSDGSIDALYYDINGRKVKSFYFNTVNNGFNEVKWDGRNDFGQEVASGVYFYRIAIHSDKLVSKENTFPNVRKLIKID